VTGFIDSWKHAGRPRETWGQVTVTSWWVLPVSGPLPGCLAEPGEFVLEVSRYADRPGWWITAG
jgi:hypothetical protein